MLVKFLRAVGEDNKVMSLFIILCIQKANGNMVCIRGVSNNALKKQINFLLKCFYLISK
jgi:hypothetical protein